MITGVFLTKRLEERQSVDVGHVPVKKDQVGRFGFDFAERVLAVTGLDHVGVPKFGQCGFLNVPHRS